MLEFYICGVNTLIINVLQITTRCKQLELSNFFPAFTLFIEDRKCDCQQNMRSAILSLPSARPYLARHDEWLHLLVTYW